MPLLAPLAAGVGALGGFLTVRRWRGWDPGDGGAGAGVRRVGRDLADRAGDLTQRGGTSVTSALAGTVRTGGAVTAGGVAVAVDLIDGLVTRLVPGTRHGADDAEPADAPTAADTKAPRRAAPKPTKATKPKKTATKAAKKAATTSARSSGGAGAATRVPDR